VHEVGVQRDGTVTLGAVAALQRQTQQLLQAPGVAAPLPVRDDAERQHFGVRCQNGVGPVARGVVDDEQLVLAGKGGEHLPHFPQNESDCAGFVIRRNADVDHGPAI